MVKENIGREVQDFRNFFAGEIFLDEKVRKNIVGIEVLYESTFSCSFMIICHYCDPHFFICVSEMFLRSPKSKDGWSGPGSSGCFAEPPPSLEEGLPWQHQGGGLYFGRGLCDWTCMAGKVIDMESVLV